MATATLMAAMTGTSVGSDRRWGWPVRPGAGWGSGGVRCWFTRRSVAEGCRGGGERGGVGGADNPQQVSDVRHYGGCGPDVTEKKVNSDLKYHLFTPQVGVLFSFAKGP